MAKAKDRYEDIVDRLEQVVTRLEGGELSLEESVALFREGIGLVKTGSQRLNEMEGKVEVLLQQSGEGERTRPFLSDEGGAEEDDLADEEADEETT